MSKQNHDTMDEQNFKNKIDFLDGAERRRLLPPEEILNILPIEKSHTILDAGAGSGYLTVPAAKLVNGAVYALDMDARMLDMIAAKAKAENITNIKLVPGSIDDIPLPEESADIVLASLILHEVRPLSRVLQQIRRVLKEDGHFLCLEYEKEEGTVPGPPMHIRIHSSEMEQELLNAGFHAVQKIYPGKSIYIITAKKTAVQVG